VFRITLRSLWEHKRRLISTVVAIVLGVAFMSGTFVLADTLDKVFDDLFAQVNENVDAQVQGEELFDSQFGGSQRKALADSLIETVAAVEGVDSAAGYVQTLGFGTTGRILDAEGERVGSAQGPPTLLESWVEDDNLNPYRLSQGRAPTADDEIALNVAAADEGNFELGDTVSVISQLGTTEYTLTGTITFGEAESSAGSVSAEFTLAEAQRIAGTPGEVQAIVIDGAEELTQAEVVDRVAQVVPADAEVITGEAAAEQDAQSVQEGFSFFRQILQIFGVIALLVGIFIISNTFSILIAQRTQELALLRAIGASRRQVLLSVLLEAVVIGLVASVLGLIGGILLANGVTAGLNAIGADLPSDTLVIGSRTVVVAFAIGLVVTVVSSVVPAIRATQVAPLAALQQVGIDRSGASRTRAVAGIIIIVASGLLMAQAWRADGDTDVLPVVGLGGALAILGAIVIGPVLAAPTVRAIGAPLPRLLGVTGRLAIENAARSPKRTSATASALIIGVTLIGFITVFAQSAKTSISAEIERTSADLVVQAESGGFGPPGGIPAEIAESVAEVEGVEIVSALAFSPALFTYPDGDTATQFLSGIDPPTLSELAAISMEQGAITDLTDAGIVVDRRIAADNDLAIGDAITVTGPTGKIATFRIDAISDDTVFIGFWALTRSGIESVTTELLDVQVLTTLAGGADLEETRAAMEAAVADTPGIEVLDRDELVGDLAAQITSFLNIVYGLLALSIIIAMIGIANTLSLSIHERTRELGLLRAVGMTRAQLRSAVRWEAVMISVLGAVVGLGLGLVISAALVKALEGFGLSQFDVPVTQLIVLVCVAALLGILASVRPARRAARMDVLEAIAEE
jgi:putative ABC transport system permease protein